VRKAVREFIVACEGRFGDVRRANVDFHDLSTHLKLAHTHSLSLSLSLLLILQQGMVGGGVGTEVVFCSSAHRSRNQGLLWAPWRGDFDDANDIRVQSRGGTPF
jgi:hypothetical protein